MTLEAIKEAIGELPATEQTSLASWLYAQDAEAWNRQIEADFSDGGQASFYSISGTLRFRLVAQYP